MVEQTRRLHLLVEQVIGLKTELDDFTDEEMRVRARPPASFEILASLHRTFDERGMTTPRDYERILRAHDGIEHMWRSPHGSVSLYGHREVMAQRAQPGAQGAQPGGAAAPAVVIAASDAGERIALVPGATELSAVTVTDPNGRVAARFPSTTSWLEWIAHSMRERLDELTSRRRRDARQSRDPLRVI